MMLIDDREVNGGRPLQLEALDIPLYSAFINLHLVPVEHDGAIIDVPVGYPDDFAGQMLEYTERCSFLPTWNF